MTKQYEQIQELDNLLYDLDSQSKIIELIADKLSSIHSRIGLDGRNVPSDKKQKEKLGKDVLTCTTALDGISRSMEATLDKVMTISSEMELRSLGEAKQ